ncbi:hypothetical protein D3C78_1675050 [compost metagenome]
MEAVCTPTVLPRSVAGWWLMPLPFFATRWTGAVVNMRLKSTDFSRSAVLDICASTASIWRAFSAGIRASKSMVTH